MSKTYIAEAPQFINRCIQKEIDDEKAELKELKVDKWCKPTFFIMYQDAKLEDDTGETYYKVGLYKSLGGFTVRWDEDLKEVLKFLKWKQKLKGLRIQILNCDEVNKAMKGE